MSQANKTYSITTFGCQMNAHDSEKLAGIMRGMGYSPAACEEDAGLVIYNTCCIRENAENKIIGRLGYLKHLKKKNTGLLVAVGGCMPQQKKALTRLLDTQCVDIMFGTHNLHMFGKLLQQTLDTGKQTVDIREQSDNSDKEYTDTVLENPFRSGINITYGCDNYCSYCVVPYVRGREHSRPAEAILTEAAALVRGGVKEITLLGQNVNSYGQKPPGAGQSFPELLRAISALSPLVPRIRFMTSHPKDLSPALIKAVKESDNVCKHIHLPVQSGSDNVLKRMNRKYTRQDYLSLIKTIRSEIPGVSVTTDIITGFPGETEQDFEDTLSLAAQARFNGAFTFLYSKRSGTPAAEMQNQIDESTAKRRFRRLISVINPIVHEINISMEGKTLAVLAEKFENGIYTGRADDNSLIHFTSPDENCLTGKIVNVKITAGKPFYLLGEGS